MREWARDKVVEAASPWRTLSALLTFRLGRFRVAGPTAYEVATSQWHQRRRRLGRGAGPHHTDADQDLDPDSHQEREDRAEHDSRGNRPYGPGGKAPHGITAR